MFRDCVYKKPLEQLFLELVQHLLKPIYNINLGSLWTKVACHSTHVYFNGTIHEFLPSAIRILQPFKLLIRNRNTAWMPLTVLTKLITWHHRKSLPSQKFLIFLRRALNDAWNPALILTKLFYLNITSMIEPVFIKLGMYVCCCLRSSRRHIPQILPPSSTTTRTAAPYITLLYRLHCA
jgi:hypothetical protein